MKKNKSTNLGLSDEEFDEMTRSKTAHEIIHELYIKKIAGYQPELSCEVCGYVGEPKYNGKCPSCGAQGGVEKPKPPRGGIFDPPYSRSQKRAEFSKAVAEAMANRFNFL